jgi:hypothetical protein
MGRKNMTRVLRNPHTTTASHGGAPHAATASPSYGIAPVRRDSFSTDEIHALQHGFHHHPLLQLPALERLAHELVPTQQCRFISAQSTQASAFDHSGEHEQGHSIADVFERIEQRGSWVALYNVETVPRYRALLDEIIASVQPLLAREQPGVFNVGGFVFISAPPSVTPFHIDRENNFWLQIAGRKVMSVFDARDRDLVSQPDLEDFIAHGSLEKVRLAEALRSRAREFDVGPGDGVYFPSTSPHMTRTTTDWVRPGEGVSISIGVVFYSQTTRHHARVHQLNRVLRRAGFSPTMPGHSRWRDAVKAPLGWALTAVRARTGRYQPPPGAY